MNPVLKVTHLILIMTCFLFACAPTEDYPSACEDGVDAECSRQDEIEVHTDQLGAGGITAATAGIILIGETIATLISGGANDKKQSNDHDSPINSEIPAAVTTPGDQTPTTPISEVTPQPNNSTTNVSAVINNNGSSTSSSVVTLGLKATDERKINGYFLSETNLTPTSTQSGWHDVQPPTTNLLIDAAFTLKTASTLGSQSRSVYVWFRNSDGIVSPVTTDEIQLSVDDLEPPKNSSMIISDGAEFINTTIQWSVLLSATDNKGVAAYFLSELDSSPSSTDLGWETIDQSPITYSKLVTFKPSPESREGSFLKTLYVWFKDPLGNISERTSDSITLVNAVGRDIAAPTLTSLSINNGTNSTNLASVKLRIAASDDTGVTGYLIAENPSPPIASTQGWIPVTASSSYSAEVPYTLSNTSGTIIVYLWFKDAAGNISTTTSSQITQILDTKPPTLVSLTINSGAQTTNQSLVSIAPLFSDEVGVTAYLLSEQNITPALLNSNWITIDSTTFLQQIIPFTLSSGNGTKIIYAWTHDAAGNISSTANRSIQLTN